MIFYENRTIILTIARLRANGKGKRLTRPTIVRLDARPGLPIMTLRTQGAARKGARVMKKVTIRQCPV
jgi:hypothetical protein